LQSAVGYGLKKSPGIGLASTDVIRDLEHNLAHIAPRIDQMFFTNHGANGAEMMDRSGFYYRFYFRIYRSRLSGVTGTRWAGNVTDFSD